MRLLSVTVLALAAGCSAPPPAPAHEPPTWGLVHPDLLRRLASDDLADREAASAELDALPLCLLPELEALARRQRDPEVAGRLAGAATRIRERHAADLARTLGCWLAYSEEDVARVARLRECALPALVELLDDEGCASAAWVFLRAFTDIDLPLDADAWRAAVAALRGRLLREVLRDTLERQGYRVRDADANVAAAELVRAYLTEPCLPRGIPDEPGGPERRSPVIGWLLATTLHGALVSREPGISREERLRRWLVRHEGRLVWSGERIHADLR